MLGWEGGFTSDAGDPGSWTGGSVGSGECLGTNFGIASADYAGVLRALPENIANAMPGSVSGLSPTQAQLIYQLLYWTPISGDSLPPALAMIVFDGAVNSGVSQSAQWLQVVLGVTADGMIGPETLAAVASYPNGAAELCWETLAQRVAANGCDPNFSVFGLGWSRRTSALAFRAAGMLTGVTA